MKLIEQYPQMFTQPSFQYGWPNGWNQLVTDLVHEIAKLDSDIEVVQIKEKFGGLRFYYSHGNESIKKLVDEAENKSYTICQVCGTDKGSQHISCGWISTLCEECHNKP